MKHDESDVRYLGLTNQRAASSTLAGNDLLIIRVLGVGLRETMDILNLQNCLRFCYHEGFTTLNGGSIFGSGLSVILSE